MKNPNSSREPLTLLWDKNMKLKNRGFTLLELLLLLAVVASAASVLITFSMRQKPVPELLTIPAPISIYSNSELVVKEHGNFFQYKYVVFEDKLTKTRIFYYHDAMIVLPPKTNGN